MLGKRNRPPFRRTTSMTGITVDIEAPPPPPPATQKLMIGGEIGGYEHLLSPRYYRMSSSGESPLVEPADFLRRCGLCNRRLVPGRDIYMYMGDIAFCSLECREQQMKQDERIERRSAGKTGESHHVERAATTTISSGSGGTVAAA